jgi:hypothetical protein
MTPSRISRRRLPDATGVRLRRKRGHRPLRQLRQRKQAPRRHPLPHACFCLRLPGIHAGAVGLHGGETAGAGKTKRRNRTDGASTVALPHPNRPARRAVHSSHAISLTQLPVGGAGLPAPHGRHFVARKRAILQLCRARPPKIIHVTHCRAARYLNVHFSLFFYKSLLTVSRRNDNLYLVLRLKGCERQAHRGNGRSDSAVESKGPRNESSRPKMDNGCRFAIRSIFTSWQSGCNHPPVSDKAAEFFLR